MRLCSIFKIIPACLVLILSKNNPALGFVLPRSFQSYHASSFPSLSTATTDTGKHHSSPVILNLTPSANKIAIATQSNNVLRGKLMLFVSKILVSPARYWEIIVERILPNTYWPEVVLITAMVNAIPLSRWTYGKRPKNRDRKEDAVDKHWKKSKQFQFALVLRQVGLLQAILYVSDVFLVLLKLLDFKFVVKYQAAQVAGSVIFASWFAYNLSRLKYHVLIRNNGVLSLASIKRRKKRRQEQSEDNDPFDGNDTVPGASSGVYNRFANRILDVIIYLCASLSIVDMLGIQAGIAVKSIFGLGSFGTLALSLASKDLAAEFVGGVMVQSTNFFDEGETVVLQDGTRGSVAKIGWLHTYILKEDDYIVRVPNSQISHQRIARLKRAPTSKRKRF